MNTPRILYTLVSAAVVLASMGIYYRWPATKCKESYRKTAEQNILKSQYSSIYDIISDYMVSHKRLSHFDSRPKCWILLPTPENVVPYVRGCLSSIIQHCGTSFNIIMVDAGKSNTAADEMMRQDIMYKFLYTHGGILVPPTFICERDLYSMYATHIQQHQFAVVKSAHPEILVPELMVVSPGSTSFHAYYSMVTDAQQNSFDLSVAQEKIRSYLQSKKVASIPPRLVGAVMERGEINNVRVYVQDIFGTNKMVMDQLPPERYGVYVDDNTLRRMKSTSSLRGMSIAQLRERDLNVVSLLD